MRTPQHQTHAQRDTALPARTSRSTTSTQRGQLPQLRRGGVRHLSHHTHCLRLLGTSSQTALQRLLAPGRPHGWPRARACCPHAVWFFISSRTRSPAEMWLIPSSFATREE